jgi:hypothetical protein
MEELLSQDVCVPAVLGEFGQHVEVHPAQRERSAPVTRRMSSSPSDDVPRRDDSHASRCAWWMVAMVSLSWRMNDSSGIAGMPISARDRQVTASSNQTCSTKVACFTRPSKVVRDGHQRSARLLLGDPIKTAIELTTVLVEERFELDPHRLIDDVLGERRRERRHRRSISGPRSQAN